MSLSAPSSRHRVARAAPDEHAALASGEPGRRCHVVGPARWRTAPGRCRILAGSARSAASVSCNSSRISAPARCRARGRCSVEDGCRGDEGLGRGDADLRPRLQVEHLVGDPRDGAADDVGDGDDGRAVLARQARRRQRIRRLARLCDGDALASPVRRSGRRSGYSEATATSTGMRDQRSMA